MRTFTTITRRIGAALLLILLSVGCTAQRAVAGETARLAELLDLTAGSRVADVGAGDGQWSIRLAREVGPEGHVWATEVDDDELEAIRQRLADTDLTNITVVSGDQQATGLPAGCCDAVLLRMVYHHFTDPTAMRADLRRALRPGGLLAIVDIVPQTHWRDLEGVPDRGGHGIPADDVVAELTADGFELVSRHEPWNDDDQRFCVVLRRTANSRAP